MLYVVSGFMRTGTSAMMKALAHGGLDAAYDVGRDIMKNARADEWYDPNEGGLYELNRWNYKHPEFPRMYDGKLIKGLNSCVPVMNTMPNGIRVIFMRRDTEEIKQSYTGFFDGQLSIGEYFQTRMDKIVEAIRNRKDVISCHEFWFRDLCANPLKHYEELAAAGWPIDAAISASHINPRLCRFKIENLEQGVL